MRTRLFVVIAIAALTTTALRAASPAVWQAASAADFLKGELENLSVDARGRLILAPASTVLHDPGDPFVWSLVEGPDGALYAGTGNDGRVLKVDPSGRPSVMFDADELEIHALAAAPGGGVYAGTSPDGAVYRIDGSGKATRIFDPPDRYIWSLAVNPQGTLFVATGGDTGHVYAVTAAGAASTFYTAKATHVMSLAFDSAARLVVGTESPGRVIQLDAAGKPFVLIDSPHTDIHALRPGPDGVLYAVASSAKASPASASPRSPSGTSTTSTPTAGGTATVTVEVTSIAVASDAGAAPPSPGDGSGAIYRIQPDGLWDVLWESHGDVPYDLAVDRDGSLLVATGSRGRLYRLHGSPAEVTLVTRQKAQHLTSLLRTRAGAIVYASANPGRLYRLDTSPAASGTYESEVRDAQSVATWGVIRWRAALSPQGGVVVSTRTGNTKAPDETWSEWSAAYATAAGSAISSPKARYLQWRVALNGTGDGPALTSIAASYLPRNAKPKVLSVTIHPPGTVFQRPYPSGDPDLTGYELDPPARRILTAGSKDAVQLGKKVYEHGLLTLQWRAEDDNGDDLEYDVLYRREGDTAWKPLRQHLAEPVTVWDTASVPDGTYTVRVVASDALSNPGSSALTGTAESAPIDVDNTPPAVLVGAPRRDGPRLLMSVDVRDATSLIRSAEYTIDGQRWLPLYAVDGLADSREERFDIALSDDQIGRTLVVRAVDALNNTGSASVTVAAPTTPPAKR